MKVLHTTTGVLAIVGLGYIAGVGHALVREKPVILGVSSPASTPKDSSESVTINTPTGIDEPVEIETPIGEPTQDPPQDSAQESAHDNQDFNARLDAPVPDGMLTLRQAHQMWIDGAYFVDSRLREEYDAGHISLAAYLTAENMFSDEGEAEMQTIPPNAAVVIYCIGGEECDASKNTKALLEQFGYTDLYIMGVGYEEWAAAGLPTSLTQEEGSP